MKCYLCDSEFPFREYTLHGYASRCIACNTMVIYPEMEEHRIRKTMAAARFPVRFLDLRQTALVNTLECHVGKTICNQQPLFLFGPVATGKTLCLAILARQLVQRRHSIFFMHCGESADYLRAHNEELDAFRERAEQASHLFLDDIGMEYDKTGWWSAWLGGIVNFRFNNMLPTSATSNCVLAQLEPRLARRLSEGATILKLT